MYTGIFNILRVALAIYSCAKKEDNAGVRGTLSTILLSQVCIVHGLLWYSTWYPGPHHHVLEHIRVRCAQSFAFVLSEVFKRFR